MEIILHTIHCPKCNVLAKKLSALGIEYITHDNPDELVEQFGDGVYYPILEVDGEYLNFSDALKWIDKYIDYERNQS